MRDFYEQLYLMVRLNCLEKNKNFETLSLSINGQAQFGQNPYIFSYITDKRSIIQGIIDLDLYRAGQDTLSDEKR